MSHTGRGVLIEVLRLTGLILLLLLLAAAAYAFWWTIRACLEATA